MEAKRSHRGRVITDEDIAFIRKLMAGDPAASRRALSQQLCALWNWRQPNGALREMVCRGLMLTLHRAGLIARPPVRYVPLIPSPSARPCAERRSRCPGLPGTFDVPVYSQDLGRFFEQEDSWDGGNYAIISTRS